jgi:hypothetical protein
LRVPEIEPRSVDAALPPNELVERLGIRLVPHYAAPLASGSLVGLSRIRRDDRGKRLSAAGEGVNVSTGISVDGFQLTRRNEAGQLS